MNVVNISSKFLCSFHLLIAFAALSATAQETNLPPIIGFGESWRYWNHEMAPAPGWKSLEYNDSIWTLGAAQLGYGDGDEATVTRINPPPHPATAYFRKLFSVGSPTQFARAQLRLLRDDGAVVYINGVEVVRDGMPPGELGHNTLAAVSAGEDENTPRTHLVNISNLLRHTNVIAVEVHQVAVSSSDMSFDLELRFTELPFEERAVVSLLATQPNTSEPLPNALVAPGEFTVFRADPHLDQPLNVYLNYSGNASSADYEPLPIVVLFPAGSNTVKIPVLPKTDGLVEGPESVVARFAAMPVEIHDPTSPNRPYIQNFSNYVAEVTIQDADLSTNSIPSAVITFPPDNRVYDANEIVEIRAEGFDPNGWVARMDLRIGNQIVASTNGPVILLRTILAAGEHYIFATARDNTGKVGNSGPKKIFVSGTNVSKIFINQPFNGAAFQPGDSILISATAIDHLGYIPRVEFFANFQRIGISEKMFLTAPAPGTPIQHSIIWSNVPAGQILSNAPAHMISASGIDSRSNFISSRPTYILETNSPSLPVVSITARIPQTREAGAHEEESPGMFLLSRTGSIAEELVVGIQYDGSALPGVDYHSLPSTLRFAPGSAETNLPVFAIGDALREPSETVIARLSPEPCPSPRGLRAWWTGDGHAGDISGNGNAGIPHNVSYDTGKVASAFSLNGIDSYVEIPKSPSLAVTSFTFAAWVNPRELSWQPILEYADHNDVAGVHLWIGAGYGSPLPASLLLNVRDTHGINRSLLVPDVIPANEWSFVAGTFDQATGAAKLYLNGHQVAGSSFPNIVPRTDTMLSIGRRHPTSFDAAAGAHFKGRIDEVEIYGRALSEAELDTIFEHGANRCRTFATDPTPPLSNYTINPNASEATVTILDAESTNSQPRVSITRPANGSHFPSGVPISIEASAIDPAGYIPVVDFFAGEKLIGSSRIDFIVPPPPGTPLVHTIVWSNAPSGTHRIVARGQSSRGFAVESDPIQVTVGAERLTIAVEAVDPVGWEAPTNGLPDNAHFRISRVSGPLNQPVSVRFFLTGSATYGIDYQQVSNIVTLSSNEPSRIVAIAPLPDDIVEGNESVVLTLTNCVLTAGFTLNPFAQPPNCYDIAIGKHRAEVVIRDAPFSSNRPPQVMITAPRDGSVFQQGERVHFRAEASDPDGRVVQINMLMDGRVIASTNTFILMNSTNPPPGEHTLQAIARDDDGATNVSQRVRILVRGTNDLAFFERQLPAGFTPGTPFAVRIQARVPSGTQAWGVEDQPPQGWIVSSISDGGIFDSATGKVKFGHFLESGARTLSYVVRPLINGGTNQFVATFAGVGSIDGRNYPIFGQSTVSSLASEFHPADRNEDRRIALAEVTGYAAAWKLGETWPAGPNPIPPSFVTRAGLIWRQGEAYRFAATNPPPFCWIPLAGREGFFVSASASAASTATRSISGGPESSTPRIVTLEVEPAASVTAYNVEERIPEGWTVQNITGDGALDPIRRVVRWGLYLDSEERTLSYQLVPPDGVAAGGQLLGEVTLDGEVLTFAGADSIVSIDPETQLRLQSTELTGDGGVKLKLGGAASQICVLESSSDLVNWGFVAELFLPNGELEFRDSDAGEAQQRYYRLRAR